MSFGGAINDVQQRVSAKSALLFAAVALIASGVALLYVDPLFVIVGAVALLLGIVVLSEPFYGVLLYIFLLYVRPGDMFPPLEPLRLTLIGVALLTAAFALNVLVYRRMTLTFSPPMFFMVLFLATIAMSMSNTFNKGETLDIFTGVLRMVFMTYLIVHVVDTVQRLKGFMTGLTLIMAGLSTAIILRYFLIPDSHIEGEGGSGGIAGGFLGDGNDYAMAQNVILPWAIALVGAHRNKWLKALMVYSLLIGIIAIAVTYSRGGFIGMAVVLIAAYGVWVAHGRNYAARAFVGLVALTAIVAGILAFAPDDFLDRLGSIKDYDQDDSAIGRLDAWRASRAMFADHTFVGVGAGTFPEAYGKKYMPFDASSVVWREAHSAFFETLGELGLFGILSFYGLVVSIVVTAYRLRGAALADAADDAFFYGARRAVFLSMLGWLICSLFLSVAYYPHLFVQAMVVTVLRNLAVRRGVELPMIEEVEIVEVDEEFG